MGERARARARVCVCSGKENVSSAFDAVDAPAILCSSIRLLFHSGEHSSCIPTCFGGSKRFRAFS